MSRRVQLQGFAEGGSRSFLAKGPKFMCCVKGRAQVLEILRLGNERMRAEGACPVDILRPIGRTQHQRRKDAALRVVMQPLQNTEPVAPWHLEIQKKHRR
jgi:hypothetical protein